MLTRIYQPARTAMSSGQANTKNWVLEFEQAEAKSADPLMGWWGSGDTTSQVRLKFPTQEAAEDYARAHGIAFRVEQPKKRAPNIRNKGYGDNFAYDRKGAWTH